MGFKIAYESNNPDSGIPAKKTLGKKIFQWKASDWNSSRANFRTYATKTKGTI